MGDELPQRRRGGLAEVRCLDCGHVYSKPLVGGTTEENPGCTRCGYLGWVAADLDVIVEATRPSRSVVDLPRRPAGRRR